MLPWQIYQSYLSVRSRIRDVIKFDLWRHRGDTVSFMSTIHPKYSTEMHQNTTFYAELNGGTRWWMFHAATIDSFDAIDSWSWKIMEFAKIWPLTCHNWVKYWPRTKNNTTNREYSARAICWSFPRSSTTLRLETPRGGGHTNPTPPLHRRRWRNAVYGRGLKCCQKSYGFFHPRKQASCVAWCMVPKPIMLELLGTALGWWEKLPLACYVAQHHMLSH